MGRLLCFSLLMLALALSPAAIAAVAGDVAPVFKAASTKGEITLDGYKGLKNVVLAFYYKDFTGG